MNKNESTASVRERRGGEDDPDAREFRTTETNELWGIEAELDVLAFALDGTDKVTDEMVTVVTRIRKRIADVRERLEARVQ